MPPKKTRTPPLRLIRASDDDNDEEEDSKLNSSDNRRRRRSRSMSPPLPSDVPDDGDDTKREREREREPSASYSFSISAAELDAEIPIGGVRQRETKNTASISSRGRGRGTGRAAAAPPPHTGGRGRGRGVDPPPPPPPPPMVDRHGSGGGGGGGGGGSGSGIVGILEAHISDNAMAMTGLAGAGDGNAAAIPEVMEPAPFEDVDFAKEDGEEEECDEIDFCVGCEFGQERKEGSGNKFYKEMWDYIDESFHQVSPKLLTAEVQRQYNAHIRKCLQPEERRLPWRRSMIWEHLTVHAPTPRIMDETELRTCNHILGSLRKNGIREVDRRTGKERLNVGMVHLYHQTLRAREPLLTRARQTRSSKYL